MLCPPKGFLSNFITMKVYVSVQRKIPVTILFQELEKERILLSTGIKKTYLTKAATAHVLQFLSIHLDAVNIQ